MRNTFNNRLRAQDAPIFEQCMAGLWTDLRFIQSGDGEKVPDIEVGRGKEDGVELAHDIGNPGPPDAGRA